MHVREISSHRHAATVTTDALRVQVSGFRDSEGQEYDEVRIEALGENEPLEEVHGRKIRIVRVRR